MEGLAEDEDLLFVLTTNRADLIEPALAARPGRVDLALEIPLPDGEGRRRLIALYAAGITLDPGLGSARSTLRPGQRRRSSKSSSVRHGCGALEDREHPMPLICAGCWTTCSKSAPR